MSVRRSAVLHPVCCAVGRASALGVRRAGLCSERIWAGISSVMLIVCPLALHRVARRLCCSSSARDRSVRARSRGVVAGRRRCCRIAYSVRHRLRLLHDRRAGCRRSWFIGVHAAVRARLWMCCRTAVLEHASAASPQCSRWPRCGSALRQLPQQTFASASGERRHPGCIHAAALELTGGCAARPGGGACPRYGRIDACALHGSATGEPAFIVHAAPLLLLNY